MGKTRSIVIGVALALSQAATAYAADLGYTTPLPEPCVGCGGPWYLKGYIGMATPDVDGIFDELLLTSPEFVVYDKDIKSTPLFGIGFGYDTGHWFRFDITGEYRGDAVFFANAKYAGPNGGFTFDDGAGTDEYTADIESWVGLFNTYIDLGTWHCVTPYIGGGVGFASIEVVGLKDVNVPTGGVAFAKDNTETNFAWALYAGLAYKVTPGLTIDLAYRYTDIGDAKSGVRTSYDGLYTASGVEIEDITSQDVMLSVRWALGSQPAPMPVAYK
ncbi:MAG TPA: outer membrane beta-barrel protein [Methyloceanibacter sp.]|jgi:opacity protein-like surface antigen|nr:outer membrane beta-barrel protein [Methyloceanibacter sp.]